MQGYSKYKAKSRLDLGLGCPPDIPDALQGDTVKTIGILRLKDAISEAAQDMKQHVRTVSCWPNFDVLGRLFLAFFLARHQRWVCIGANNLISDDDLADIRATWNVVHHVQ